MGLFPTIMPGLCAEYIRQARATPNSVSQRIKARLTMKIYKFEIALDAGEGRTAFMPVEIPDAKDRNEAFQLAADLGIDNPTWLIKAITYTGESA